jgi:hypothetical protein
VHRRGQIALVGRRSDWLLITDAKTGRIIDQSAFFTGADDARASGVGMVIKHTVLPSKN